MATRITDIYSIFLNQIDDDILALLEPTVKDEMLLIYLKGAISRFPQCEKDLTISQTENEIAGDLDITEMEILADGMVLYWLQPKILREDNITAYITDSDLSQKSPANLLSKLHKLRTDSERDLKIKTIAYTYRDFTEGWY